MNFQARSGFVALLVIFGMLGPQGPRAGGSDARADDIPLSATFVTESVLPATEIEAGFSYASSDAERKYQIGFSSLQYSWGAAFGLKLVVPFGVVEPRDDGATVAGPRDIQLLAQHVPVVSAAHLFALGGALKLTLPTGSERRGLGGALAVAPGLLAGKAWRVGESVVSLQGDAFYEWRLDRPAKVDGELRDRDQRFTANLTAAVTATPVLTAIVEMNAVALVAGDPALRGRGQVYVTPGLAFDLAPGWSVRAGVQVPLTSARELNYNVVFFATKGF